MVVMVVMVIVVRSLVRLFGFLHVGNGLFSITVNPGTRNQKPGTKIPPATKSSV
jgi:hypothetical protein